MKFQTIMQENDKDKINHLSSVFVIILKHMNLNNMSNFFVLQQIFKNFYQKLNLSDDQKLKFSDHKHQNAYVWKNHLVLQCKKMKFEQSIRVFHDVLKWKLIKIEIIFNSMNISLNQKLKIKLIQNFSDILKLYMIILLQKKSFQIRLQFLSNQLWKDLQWYFAIANNEFMHIQKIIADNTYKFMTAFVEVVLFYKIY